MRASPFRPSRGQILVCVNRRPDGDPLGTGCGDRGEAVYSAMRRGLSPAGLSGAMWVTRTHCQGICPAIGACVTLPSASEGGDMLTEVTPADVPAIVLRLTRA
jgi:hypothetical protein